MSDLEHLVVLNDTASAFGGTATLALLSARMAAARGVRVTYVSGGPPGDDLARAGVEAVCLDRAPLLARPRLAAFSQGLHDRGVARALAAWIAAHDGPRTVYHLHGWAQALSPSVFQALRPVAARTVLSAHDYALACPNVVFQDYPRQRPCELRPMSAACWARPCDKRNALHKLWRMARQVNLLRVAAFARTPFHVVAIHEGMVERLALAGLPPGRISTIRDPAAPWSATRIEAEANRVALFVGRVSAEKGADVLLAAARRAGVPARVVGDGDDRARLQALHPEAGFTGWVDRAGVVAAARDARVVVMPSRLPEPFGLVAVEAARSGLPVLLAREALVAPELERLGAGVAIDVRDVEALGRRLAALAGDDAAVERMSRAGFERGGGLATTPDEWLDRFLDLYARRLREAARAT